MMNVTRRDIIKGGIGLSGILATGTAPAFMKSLIGATQTAFVNVGAGKITARSYVQNGLVAMWDGIENVGWGLHDSNSTTWKNLIDSKGDATLTQYGHFSDDAFIGLKDSTATVNTNAANIKKSYYPTYIEAVVNVYEDHRRDNGPIIALENPSGLVFSSTFKSLFANGLSGKGGTITLGEKVAFSAPGNGTAPVYVNGIDSTMEAYHYIGTSYHGFVRVNRGSAAVHCCRLYDRILTYEEVLHNYEIDKERFGL